MALFDQLGGSAVIASAVDEFYERVLDDAALAPSFDGIEITRLKAHQRAFLTAALGGPPAYDGRSMSEAHAGLGITLHAFNETVGHLVATLVSMDVDDATVHEVVQLLAPLAGEIVGSVERVAS